MIEAPTRNEERHRRQEPATASRVGYLVAVVGNALCLYVAHRLLDWEWPGFLTPDYDRLLPAVTATCVAAMVVNVVFFVRNDTVVLAAGNLITGLFGTYLSVRTLQVFPFDFAGYRWDWSWALWLLSVAALVGSVVGVAVNGAKLIGWRLLAD